MRARFFPVNPDSVRKGITLGCPGGRGCRYQFRGNAVRPESCRLFQRIPEASLFIYNKDAFSGRLRLTLLAGQRLQQIIHYNDKTDGRRILPEIFQKAVVTAALGNRVTNAVGIGFKITPV